MQLKFLVDEDFVNYKKGALFLGFPHCTFKCDKENGNQYCQNWSLSKQPNIEYPVEKIVARYVSNPITHSIVAGGLEPMDSWDDLLSLITELRKYTTDDFVIYTGYWYDEIKDKIDVLKQFPNIVIKFGRYRPNQEKHLDPVLGVLLANKEQYGERIS